MGYSTELANKLRLRLFLPRVFRDHKARYDKRDDASEGLATETWAVHGVCLECRCWSISCGRCAECAHVYGDGRKTISNMDKIYPQIELAKKLTHA